MPWRTGSSEGVSRDDGRVTDEHLLASWTESQMRIVVGGTGLVGRKLSEILGEDGHEVVVAARSEGSTLRGVRPALARSSAQRTGLTRRRISQ
jgi:glutamate dehydrogenase/leucine dehydrogenase